MNSDRAHVGWGFWLWWVLASTVGFAVSFAVASTMYAAVGLIVGIPMLVAVGGASVGIAQWLVLRRQVARAGWWVLASTVGLFVGFAMLVAVNVAMNVAINVAMSGAVFAPVGETVLFILSFAVFGASVGIAQWLVLRRQVARAGWWVLASTVGGAVGMTALGAAASVGDGVGLTVGRAVSLVVYEAITGGVLVWLLRQPPAEELIPSRDAA